MPDANDPVAKYIPEFAANGKQDITVRNLLTHFSGLRPDIDLTPAWEGRDAALRLSFAETPAYPPGSRFVYSDTNFIALGVLVERVSGTTLDATYDFALAEGDSHFQSAMKLHFLAAGTNPENDGTATRLRMEMTVELKEQR